MQVGRQQIVKLGKPIELSDNEFNRLSKFIYNNYGINLPITKKTLLESRLQKHLRKLGISSFSQYIDTVCKNEENAEVINMINLVSTNKTHFFREAGHFSYLTNEILPLINPNTEEKLQIWSAAASSGEEAYSVAITIEEFIAQQNHNISYSILATDISTDVLHVGKNAIYNEAMLAQLPFDKKSKYFLRSKDRSQKKVRVVKKLRDKVTFQRFNLIQDKYPKHESFDIIFCRNVLIYFDRATQEKVIRDLARSLREGGYLFLGHSESLMGLDLPLEQRVHTGYQKVM